MTYPKNWKHDDTEPCAATEAVRFLCDPNIVEVHAKKEELKDMTKAWILFVHQDGKDVASTSLSDLMAMGPCK